MGYEDRASSLTNNAQKFTMIFLKYLPFSLHWIIRRSIGNKNKTILDLGCGDGSFTRDISVGEDWQIIGLELYENSIRQAKELMIYNQVLKGDVTRIPRSITSKKYDVVFLSQVIEHLPKSVGELALKRWEKLAKKKMIVTTPVGFMEFDRVEKRGMEENKLQKHLSGWKPEEFSKRGYKVYGQGVNFIYGKDGLVRKTHPIFWLVLILISYLTSPIVYYFPKLGTYMVAVKPIKR